MADLRTVLVLCILLLLSHSAFQQSTAPLNSRAERVALLQLRSSLGLRSREWPIKGDPCLNWSGIQCSNGRVTGINISGFKRTRIGNLNPQFSVDALANFSLLSSFNASKFALPGQIPEWFGQRLIALQVLDLRSCSIRGPIPSSLGSLTNLTALYLSENGLTGIIPSTLGQLSSLSVLDLAQNSLTGSIPFSFASLSNITFLDMSSNFVSGPIPLAIGTLFNLQILNLSNNSLSSSIPVQLGDLSSLVDLDLSSNSLSGSLPQDLRGLRNLQRMVIGRNLLTGSLPGNLFPPLTQLQFIALNHNNFTGQIPNVLWSMPQLRFLDASTNNFTGTLPNPNPSPNTSAAVFNLSHNLLYGTLSSILTRFNFIDISGNYFQGNIPDRTTTNVSLDTNCLQNISNQRTSAECSSFYTERGLTFDNFGIPIAPPPPQPSRRDNNRNKRVYILAGVLGGLGLIAVLVALLVLLLLCSRKRNNTNQRSVGVGPVPTGGASPSLPPGAMLDFSSLGESFTFQQILQATSEFSDLNLIKHGHSGDLYRGLLTGIPVVIKKVDLGTVKKESYMIELDFFNKVSHPRLVPLLGHCLEKENEKFLVYKYMPNRDLSSSLFWRNDTDEDRLQSLDWITRLKIATGAAESLSYLHHECHPPLVHRDVQASSILLDDKYEVRLGSLSDVCAQEGDVHQSRITRFLRLPTTSEQGASGTHTATCAYDVYCFGKVLLELVTGKLGISASSANGSTSKDWMESTLPYISIYDKELVTNIVDPTLIIDEDLLEEVWAMAVVARSCLNPKPSRRPLMRYVLKALENPVKVVREENTSSARLRTTSSRGSWNAALFGGSWRQSSSDVAAAPKVEGGGSRTTGSQGSGGHNGGGADNSSSTRRHSSRDIFPEPLDVERLHED